VNSLDAITAAISTCKCRGEVTTKVGTRSNGLIELVDKTKEARAFKVFENYK
jgi:hypothetical protein